MNAPDRAFYGLLGLSVVVAAGLTVASARLVLPLASDAAPAAGVIARWCLRLFSGSPATDELVMLGLLGLLPTTALLGLASLGRQWRATRRLVRAQLTARPDSPPARLGSVTRRLGLAGRLEVVQSAQPYAFCYGLLRPRIRVSTGLTNLLSEGELEAVMLHERHHLRSRDPLKILLTRALGRAFFFLPLIAELGRYYLVAKEVEADRAVIRAQGGGRQLAAVLLKLALSCPGIDQETTVAGLGGVIETRIDSLLGAGAPVRPRPSSAAIGLSALVLVAIAVVVLAPNLVGGGVHLHALSERGNPVCPLSLAGTISAESWTERRPPRR